VDGVLSRVGDRLHLTVRMGDTRLGTHPWSYTCEHPLSEAIKLFSDIAASIADEIQLNLTWSQRRRLRIAPAVSPEVQESYLRGCHERSKRTPDGVRKAFPYLKAALERAPDYALAHVGMSEWYLSASHMRLISIAEGLLRGRAAANEALRLDRHCADAHVLLGMFAWFDWDRRAAIAQFGRATAINPNLAKAYLGWSRCHLCIAEFDEAEERLSIAAQLDPLSPLVLRQLATQALCRGRYREAVRFGRETIAIYPDDWHAPYVLGLAQHALGQDDEALATLRRAVVSGEPFPSVVAALALVLTATDHTEEARQLGDWLRDHATQGEVTPYDFAEYMAAMKDDEQALRYLERSYQLRLPDLLGIRVDPIFAYLRADCRFEDLERRLGLRGG
jgi:tetratricopeptide (TPR) repeat protein